MQCRDDSEVWELFIQFDGVKFVQKTMARCDIRYLNLLSEMEKEGYGICSSIYYVKEEGEGLQGLDVIDSQLKVDEMIRKYDSSKKLVLTVMRDKKKHAIVVSPIKPIKPKSVKFIGKEYPSYIDVDADAEEEQPIPYQVQTQDSVCYQGVVQTQNSAVVDKLVTEECDGEASDDSYGWWDEGQVDPVYAEERRRRDEEELQATIAEMKRRREDPLLHYEGETDVEDIFVNDEEENVEEIPAEPVKKKVDRKSVV